MTYSARTQVVSRRSFLSAGVLPLGAPLSGSLNLDGSNSAVNGATSAAALEQLPKDITPQEAKRLAEGGSAERRFELTLNNRPYLAALSYSGVSRPRSEVFRIMSTPADLPKALPVTRDTRFVNNNSQMYVVQGTFLIHGSYTLHWHADEASGLVRFWLDPKLPHDITDVVGFFRVTEQGPERCLLTVAVAVDIGDNPVATMFKGKVHDYLSRPARYVARYIKQRAPHSSGAEQAK